MPEIILGTKNNGIKLKQRISTMLKKKKKSKRIFFNKKQAKKV